MIGSEGGKPLDQPEHRRAADHVGRHQTDQGRPSWVQGRWRESTHGPTAQPNGRDHDSDEGEVSELDANAEQQQRERDVPLRQSRLAQPAREAQPMQETEAERNEPRLSLCRKRPSPLATGNPKTCVCGIVYALGSVNFLFDRSQTPSMNAAELCAGFGVSKSTGSAKAKVVRDAARADSAVPRACPTGWTWSHQCVHIWEALSPHLSGLKLGLETRQLSVPNRLTLRVHTSQFRRFPQSQSLPSRWG